jgi:hypothetical protein
MENMTCSIFKFGVLDKLTLKQIKKIDRLRSRMGKRNKFSRKMKKRVHIMELKYLSMYTNKTTLKTKMEMNDDPKITIFIKKR